MKPQSFLLALASMVSICEASGKAWFYKDKDCVGYEKNDKKRVHTSGAYQTYETKCYNDETNRTSFLMAEDLDDDGTPWPSCMRISSGPWCTGETIGMNVLADGECYNIPDHLPISSFRFTLGTCGEGDGPRENELDEATCRWGTHADL